MGCYVIRLYPMTFYLGVGTCACTRLRRFRDPAPRFNVSVWEGRQCLTRSGGGASNAGVGQGRKKKKGLKFGHHHLKFLVVPLTDSLEYDGYRNSGCFAVVRACEPVWMLRCCIMHDALFQTLQDYPKQHSEVPHSSD